jgi:hypothetical protein
MKPYMFIFAVFFCLLSSCRIDPLDRTVFIPDPTDPYLPAYTEWGYNSFGAIHERNYFVSSERIVPCKIVYRDGMLEFSLAGWHDHLRDAELIFSFPVSSKIEHPGDLYILHGSIIDLKGNDVSVRWRQHDQHLEEVSGYLHFRRFQLLLVDGRFNRIILSGVFNVNFLSYGRPESISHGRFDLGITCDDFWSHNMHWILN